jgi:hypothetical protein
METRVWIVFQHRRGGRAGEFCSKVSKSSDIQRRSSATVGSNAEVQLQGRRSYSRRGGSVVKGSRRGVESSTPGEEEALKVIFQERWC